MSWNFRGDTPIYIQIADFIKRDIFAGKYAPGDRIPGVREIAMSAAVNPNTVQHAMNMLEDEGLLVTQSTAGRFVTADPTVVASLRVAFAESICNEMLTKLSGIGLDGDQVLESLDQVIRNHKLN